LDGGGQKKQGKMLGKAKRYPLPALKYEEVFPQVIHSSQGRYILPTDHGGIDGIANKNNGKHQLVVTIYGTGDVDFPLTNGRRHNMPRVVALLSGRVRSGRTLKRNLVFCRSERGLAIQGDR